MDIFINNAKKILIFLVVILLVWAGYAIWQTFHPTKTVTIDTKQAAETTQGVEKAADNANINIVGDQGTEISKLIKTTQTKVPDSTVFTTASRLAKTIEDQKEKVHADFAIITPAKDSVQINTDVVTKDKINTDTVKDVLKNTSLNTTVNLNQYNIQAYPRHFIEGTIYTDNSIDIAYLTRVKIFKATGYVGPAIQHSDKTRIGVRLSVPF